MMGRTASSDIDVEALAAALEPFAAKSHELFDKVASVSTIWKARSVWRAVHGLTPNFSIRKTVREAAFAMVCQQVKVPRLEKAHQKMWCSQMSSRMAAQVRIISQEMTKRGHEQSVWLRQLLDGGDSEAEDFQKSFSK